MADNVEMIKAFGVARSMEGALTERAAIVVWLRERAETSAIWRGVYRLIADAIERGDHLKAHPTSQ